MRREMYDKQRRLRPRTWKAMRDERPVWARHYRGEYSYRKWYTEKIPKRCRLRVKKADRHDCWFIKLNFGSWRAREETWPALRW